MKSASDKQRTKLNVFFNTNPALGSELTSARHLHTVAETFIDAQLQRHTPDYDNAIVWTAPTSFPKSTLLQKLFKVGTRSETSRRPKPAFSPC